MKNPMAVSGGVFSTLRRPSKKMHSFKPNRVSTLFPRRRPTISSGNGAADRPAPQIGRAIPESGDGAYLDDAGAFDQIYAPPRQEQNVIPQGWTP